MFKLKEPYVIIAVGIPLSGKSSYFSKNYPDASVICRDSIILEISGIKDYNKAFKEVNHREVDDLLRFRLKDNSNRNINTIVDMTHMSAKRRRFNLSFFKKDYYKVAIVFPFIDKHEWKIRNEKRKLEENKDISWDIMENMIKSYTFPKKEEGFNKIISL